MCICGEITISAKKMLTVVLIADGKWQMADGQIPRETALERHRQTRDYIQPGLNFPTLLFFFIYSQFACFLFHFFVLLA